MHGLSRDISCCISYKALALDVRGRCLTPCGLCGVCRIEKKGEDSYTVTYRSGSDGPEQQLDVGLVMMATGRHPRVSGLNLEVRGVRQGPCL